MATRSTERRGTHKPFTSSTFATPAFSRDPPCARSLVPRYVLGPTLNSTKGSVGSREEIEILPDDFSPLYDGAINKESRLKRFPQNFHLSYILVGGFCLGKQGKFSL